MLWGEFVEGTGCIDSEKNYKVYKDLEVMYMNSNMSKSEIYEYGKKLVDNTVVKTEEQLRLEAQIKDEINDYKELIKDAKSYIERYQIYLKECDNTEDEIRWMKSSIKTYKENIRHYRNRISALKWVLA